MRQITGIRKCMYAADDDDDDVSDECADRFLTTLLPLHTLKESHGNIVSDLILLTCTQLAQTLQVRFGSRTDPPPIPTASIKLGVHTYPQPRMK